jgi:hypothetical protein
MSILDEKKIDFLGTDKDTGEVILTITDHLEWDSESEHDHLSALQEKINTYLAFIESEEIYEYSEDARNRNIVIEVRGKYELSEAASAFYKTASAVTSEAGFSLRFAHLPAKES